MLQYGHVNLLKFAVLCLYCAIWKSAGASEKLVYAVSHGVRADWATEVFLVSPDAAEPVLLFSDESGPVKLGFAHGGDGSHWPDTAVAGNSLYAPGQERALRSRARATGIFEFALNASGPPRKILDLPAGERIDLLIVNRQVTKLAYLSQGAKGLTLFIHDIKNGNLLHKLDMTKITVNCVVRSLGWLPDDKTLFFTLDEGADGPDEDNDYRNVGTWLIQEDGTRHTRLPASLGKLQHPGYKSGAQPLMLGVVNGAYLFDSNLYNPEKGAPSRKLYALADPASGRNTEISFEAFFGSSCFVRSQSGRYIAYTQHIPTRFVGNKGIISPMRLFHQPFPAGNPREILTLDPSREPGLAITPLGWIE